MTFEQFAARARAVFDDIPLDYKEGVEGIEIARRIVPHPTLPEVFTLGECVSEHYPSEFGGGEVRSTIHLYYGSFLELSRQDEEWDWQEEIFETITHEIRHHLEHLAADDALVDADIADDHNFARREGMAFDPFFYRGGEVVGDGLFDVSGDLFYEAGDRLLAGDRREGIRVELGDWSVILAVPDEGADVHFLRVEEPPPVPCRGDFYVVLVKQRGAMRWLADLVRGRALTVLESEAELLPP